MLKCNQYNNSMGKSSHHYYYYHCQSTTWKINEFVIPFCILYVHAMYMVTVYSHYSTIMGQKKCIYIEQIYMLVYVCGWVFSEYNKKN